MMTSSSGSRLPNRLIASGGITPSSASHACTPGSVSWKKFSDAGSTMIQKIVLIPKFQPMMKPANSSRILTMNAIVPMLIWKLNRFSIAPHNTSAAPVAPPPVPCAGRIQAIHANV